MIESTPVVYVAKPAYLKELVAELGQATHVANDLVFSPVVMANVCFALDAWLNPTIVHFASISEAVKILRQAGKYWYLHPIEQIRRSRLIEAELRKCPPLAREFPLIDPVPTIGCFTLLDKNTLVFSTTRWKKWPGGVCHFVEDKLNPPNRAYLKLWEALTLLERLPAKGETAYDLGASPGGWTYVMQALGANVTAVDKAVLSPHIASLADVHFLQQSAFALDPFKLQQPIDWVLSDIACYPERCLDLVKRWIASGNAKQIIFTIKLQGETNLAMLEQFKSIPGARVLHLYHNKHEATFIYPAPPHLFVSC
jgi:23S rRNA (cytidine2498-2'-O)-methyltransferase